ncbi:hypothetical protein QF117_15470 [Vibrio sp. YMD68]|uniref:DUF6538 domain-containing protein n=1 Tax=Vibrio sp. YMD68 TaxID=3042300 RepID=UPI00249A438E|nr:DUF6538 domain-containing protein [Vibrio sp. YMD68]WGV99339.1 hypothetical protein QF117_15470 [Vibrio sp. YMD68]
MIRTGDTIMFLLKDRNATYYARYYFPKELVSKGFPNELRFSLSTKQRSMALERMLLVVGAIRNHVNQLDLNQSADVAMESIKTLLKSIRSNGFILWH